MEINIFLASSSELANDRNEFQLFIVQVNEEWAERNVSFKLKIWEDFIDSISLNGLQFEYIQVAQQCDIFLMLFFTKVGKYTSQEFEAAFKQFQTNSKPYIFTYFKEAYIYSGQINDEIISMLEFKKKLADLKHYPSTYTGIEDLKWKFNRQIDKLYREKFSPNVNISGLKNRSQIDSILIERVCKLISPQSDETVVQSLEIGELVKKASQFAKDAVFQIAKVNRRSNRTSDTDLMSRSIPIFKALIDSNKKNDRHYYYGQLAYALKDQNNADWENAESNFDMAINIRGSSEPEYFYEFNRAICKIVKSESSTVAETDLFEMILQDLRFSKKGIGERFVTLVEKDIENRSLYNWIYKNKISISDL